MSKSRPTIVFLSTYPPRECGIATFTQDLLKSCQKFQPLTDFKVAALNVSPLDTYKYPSEVEWKIDQNSKTDFQNLAKTINDSENISGVIIQHEYGIFGGPEGEILLTFMKNCKKPMLVTLHTVLPNPSPKMKEITQNIVSLARTIVILTKNSKEIIENIYPESVGKVFMIPHGIHQVAESESEEYKKKLKLSDYTILSTFGLLNRGKGIEYVLHALPSVIKKDPSVMYLILGETHPVIRRAEGEKYRIELARLITKLGLKKHVKFYDQYFGLSDLFEFLKATDIYISPSINLNQAVSGTLSYALGTGRTVISTEFAQAKEIVTKDTGRLIPIKNSPALSSAILDLLSDKKRLKQMHIKAYKITRPMLWNNVAAEYTKLLNRFAAPEIKLDHLLRMTDDFGLFQFASLTAPDKDFGYTLDDNARALIVCSMLLKEQPTKTPENLLRIYLSFIKRCQQKNGTFVNYIGFKDKAPTVQNQSEDLEDAQTRALWALSEVMSNTLLPADTRIHAKKMFLLRLEKGIKLTHLRSKALMIKSFALALPMLPEKKSLIKKNIKNYADSLISSLNANSIKSWKWFETNLNYNNAILPEGLLIAGKIMKNETYTEQAFLSLTFLISKTFSKTYIPIGHSHWYKNKKERSRYDQQPEDPASMILALSCAFEQTGDTKYKNLANKCFRWFLGDNTLKKSLYDAKSGGCFDGLHPERVNLNQGAESLVSYLMSNLIISKLNNAT